MYAVGRARRWNIGSSRLGQAQSEQWHSESLSGGVWWFMIRDLVRESLSRTLGMREQESVSVLIRLLKAVLLTRSTSTWCLAEPNTTSEPAKSIFDTILEPGATLFITDAQLCCRLRSLYFPIDARWEEQSCSLPKSLLSLPLAKVLSLPLSAARMAISRCATLPTTIR